MKKWSGWRRESNPAPARLRRTSSGAGRDSISNSSVEAGTAIAGRAPFHAKHSAHSHAQTTSKQLVLSVQQSLSLAAYRRLPTRAER